MPKPLWLLDIDGVVNAICMKPDTNVWPKDQWRFKRVQNSIGSTHKDGWPCWVAKPVVDFIAKVHEEDRAEIFWHTTWQEEANDFGFEFNLPHFPVWPAPEFKEAYKSQWSWWKTAGFTRALDDDRPVVWTDDDIPLVMMRQYSNRSLAALFAPSSNCGLSPKNLRIISEYLDLHQGGE